MNKSDLKEELEKEHFDPRFYDLDGGSSDECLVLSDERSQWCVYYSERGMRTEEQCFKSEPEACEHFLNRIKKWPRLFRS
jgi:hypothetical protein